MSLQRAFDETENVKKLYNIKCSYTGAGSPSLLKLPTKEDGSWFNHPCKSIPFLEIETRKEDDVAIRDEIVESTEKKEVLPEESSP